MKDPYASKPWLKHYDKHVPAKLKYPNKPWVVLFTEVVEKVKDRVAIYYAGVPIPYTELDAMSNKFANFLKEKGLKQGDVVGIQLPNMPANYISIIGALKAGCVISGISPLLTEKEMEFQLNNAGAKALVAMDALWGKITPVLPKTGVKMVALTSGTDFLPSANKAQGEITSVPGISVHNYMDILATMPATPLALNMDINRNIMLQYTGGTTGVPKGAEIIDRGFVTDACQLARWFDTDKNIGTEVFLSAFPLYSIAGAALAFWHLMLGSTVIAFPNPRDFAGLAAVIEKHKPTCMCNVPTILMELLKLPAFRKIDFSFLKWCISGGAPFPPEFMGDLESVIGKGKLVESLGMTECGPFISATPLYGKKILGSVGLPVPDTEAKVLDPATGAVVPQGETGELIVKGPQTFARYHNMPEETANTLRDGWVYTGDIVRMDEEGYFYVVDRLKDMVNVSGLKVFTRELDDLICQHPDVAGAASVGIPDPNRPGSEIVVAAVVLKQGVEKTDNTSKSISEFVRQRAATYKVPKKIVFMEKLPTSSIGKILKRELREMMKK